jgi:hypothetical protein
MTGVLASVDLESFADALDLVCTGLDLENGVVRLDFRDDELVLAGPGTHTVLDARCARRCTVLVNAGMLSRLVEMLPDEETVELAIAAAGLKVGPTILSAAVMDIAPDPPHLPVGADVPEIVAALRRFGKPRLLSAIGSKSFDASLETLTKGIGDAAEILKPYGVTPDDVTALVCLAIDRSTHPDG